MSYNRVSTKSHWFKNWRTQKEYDAEVIQWRKDWIYMVQGTIPHRPFPTCASDNIFNDLLPRHID